MTRDDERKRLRALCEAATPGPWTWWTSCSFRRLSSDATGRDGDVLHGAKHHDGVCDVVGRDEDRAFIAEARTALPALLDALDRVERLAEEWEREATACRNEALRQRGLGMEDMGVRFDEFADMWTARSAALRRALARLRRASGGRGRR